VTRVPFVALAAVVAVSTLMVSSCLMDFEALRPVEGVCGNAARELGEDCDDGAGEACDDGNQEDGDGCSLACSEPGSFTIVDRMGSTATEQPFHHPSVGVTELDGKPYFVVIWIQHVSGGRSIMMRLFGTNGIAAGDAAAPVSTTAGKAICSSIASNQDGRSVVAWRMEDDAGDVHAYYNVIEPGALEPAGQDRSIADADSPNYLACPEVAAAPSGEFCIVTRSNDDIERSFCLDAKGETVTGRHELGTSLFGTFLKQGGIHAITGAQGGFLATWQDLETNRWVARQLDLSGQPLEGTSLIVVDEQHEGAWIGSGFAYGLGAVVSAGPRVAEGTHEHPRFAIRIFDSLRSLPAGDAISLVSDDHREQHAGRLVAHSSGRFAALWVDESEGICEVLVRRYQSPDEPDADSLKLVEDPLCGMHPEGAVTADGDAMFVWPQTNMALPVLEQVLDLKGYIIPRFLAPQ